MKKQYVNPQCEYWCYVTDQLCSVGEALYATARKAVPHHDDLIKSSGGLGD